MIILCYQYLNCFTRDLTPHSNNLRDRIFTSMMSSFTFVWWSSHYRRVLVRISIVYFPLMFSNHWLLLWRTIIHHHFTHIQLSTSIKKKKKKNQQDLSFLKSTDKNQDFPSSAISKKKNSQIFYNTMSFTPGLTGTVTAIGWVFGC